jgi:hypothetical protein
MQEIIRKYVYAKVYYKNIVISQWLLNFGKYNKRIQYLQR